MDEKINEIISKHIEYYKIGKQEYGVVKGYSAKPLKKDIKKLLTLYSVSKRLFVAEIVSKYKTEIISTEFTDKQEAENFIITMKEGFTYKNSELVILNVC